ncbi:MAG: hypothetical protein ACK4TA_10135 [Saprospiraceae bacterium]
MKTTNWIQLILLIGLILLGVFASIYDTNKLKECSQEGKAVIISKNRRKNRGYFIKYEYQVNGKIYSASESIDKNEELIFNLGDSIDITMSCSDYNVSRYKKIISDN